MMILIKCCANCKYFKDEICMCRESYNTGVTSDDWCPEWRERKESDENRQPR